jgi:hypothetical protein
MHHDQGNTQGTDLTTGDQKGAEESKSGADALGQQVAARQECC